MWRQICFWEFWNRPNSGDLVAHGQLLSGGEYREWLARDLDGNVQYYRVETVTFKDGSKLETYLKFFPTES